MPTQMSTPAPPPVDNSVDGIFSALTSSHDLPVSVDTLIANGAKRPAVMAFAAAGKREDQPA